MAFWYLEEIVVFIIIIALGNFVAKGFFVE